MADIKLRNYSGIYKDYPEVPKVWLEAPESTEEAPVLVPFTHGELLDGVEIVPDFSAGDRQTVSVPDGYLVKEATILKPENLKPEFIAEGEYIAGVGPGTHSGGSFNNEIKVVAGSYTPGVTGSVRVEHNLGVIPDVVILQADNAKVGSFTNGLAFSDEIWNGSAERKQRFQINGSSGSYLVGYIANIFPEDSSGYGCVSNANPKSFDIGGSIFIHDPAVSYNWTVIGGIVPHPDFLVITLSLDGNGNLLVSGGVSAIDRLEIYVDGVYAKTVDYIHGGTASVDISDVANDFKTYDISVVAIGENLDSEYPYQFCNPVSGWVMVNVEDAIAFGDCGQNVKWKISRDGVLTIAGLGAMTDYNTGSQPWYGYADQITSVNIVSGVTTIGLNMVRGHTNIVSVSIPNTVKTIGGTAFRDCTGLKSVIIPDSVESIYSHAFRNCTSLESVVIGNGVTTIELYAFHTCSALKNVTMGNSVQTINYRAFQACSSLTSIVIPASVTLMGDNVFYGCSSLTSATFEKTATWKVYTSSTATSGTTISSSYLANTSTAATYLRSTYVGRWWKRT